MEECEEARAVNCAVGHRCLGVVEGRKQGKKCSRIKDQTKTNLTENEGKMDEANAIQNSDAAWFEHQRVFEV